MVNPGFAGQQIVPSTIRKAEKVVQLLEAEKANHITLEVDGNITFQNAKILRDIGADLFVAGTSSIFNGGIENYSSNIQNLRKQIS